MAKRIAPEKSGGGAGSKAPAAGFQLVYGEDEYRVSEEARRIVSALCPVGEQVTGLETIDGRVDTVAEAMTAIKKTLEAIRQVGLFGGGKVVWLKDANFLADTVTGRSEDVKELLKELGEEIQRGLAPDQSLIISASKVDGRSSFYKVCKATKRVTAFALERPGEKAEQAAMGWAREVFRDAGLSIRTDALQAFVQKVGTSGRQIHQEAGKLATYVGKGGEATVADVQAIVSPVREGIAWDFADAVATRRVPQALMILRQLLFQKESPIALVVGIENRFRELLLFRAAMDRGWLRVTGSEKWPKVDWLNSPEVDRACEACGQDPRGMHPVRGGKLAQQAGLFSPRELAAAHNAAVATHQQLVSCPVSPEVLLDVMVVKIAGKTKARAAARA
jgi:DNA polymerase-3 subunit delta